MTVLSDDMRANVAAKLRRPEKVHVIPNFVDLDAITPQPAENAYRAEYGLTGKTVVMYAGNVGMSQSVDLLVDAARMTVDRDDVVYVVNGGGSTLADVEARAAGCRTWCSCRCSRSSGCPKCWRRRTFTWCR